MAAENIKEIVKAISELTKELKRIRKVMESWDKEPELELYSGKKMAYSIT